MVDFNKKLAEYEAIKTAESNLPADVEFFDLNSQRKMKYVPIERKHWTAGWILYQHVSGGWVTLREATLADLIALERAKDKQMVLLVEGA